MTTLNRPKTKSCFIRAVPRDSRPVRPEADPLLMGATQVQKALCATPYQRIGNLEVACTTIAARRISGDFVLSFESRGNSYVALGDLMGKGLSAAMWFTHMVDLTRRACESGDNVSEIMATLNVEVHRSRVGVPLTSLLLAQLSPARNTVTYCCGGSPPAFLLKADRSVAILHEGGPILGALQDSKYKTQTLELGPKDTLLAVSDGILEVHHGHDFEIRPDRVVDHLQYAAGASASEIVKGLAGRVISASETLADDLSLLAIQRVA